MPALRMSQRLKSPTQAASRALRTSQGLRLDAHRIPAPKPAVGQVAEPEAGGRSCYGTRKSNLWHCAQKSVPGLCAAWQCVHVRSSCGETCGLVGTTLSVFFFKTSGLCQLVHALSGTGAPGEAWQLAQVIPAFACASAIPAALAVERAAPKQTPAATARRPVRIKLNLFIFSSPVSVSSLS